MMMNKAYFLPAVLLGTTVLGATPALAQSKQTYLDVSAGVGYSTNPLLQLGDNTDSIFGRVSAYGAHSWQTERSSTRLTGFVENSTYGRGSLDSKQIFDLGAHTEYQTSEKVRLFGDLGFSGDFGGQLSTRFVTTPTAPVVPTPGTPPPLTVSDPDLFAITGRQYRAFGQVGASIKPNEREQWSFAGSVSRYFFSGAADDFNYWVYAGSAAYDRQVSERSSMGVRLTAQRSDFRNGSNATILSPQLTFRTQFSEVWDAQVAVGATYTKQETLVDDDSGWNLALDGSLCRTFESDRLCARASRYSQNTASTAVLQTTSGGIDWFKRLGEKDTLQVSANIVHYSGVEILGESTNSDYITAAGTYSRRFSDRLSGGIYLNARKLSQFGTDPKADVGGSVFLTYRFGDIR